ncbi:MAG: hypothetical protein K6F34_04775 [Lachnospiraceae bacterium]|nr:hypothetical protein [Lachnospiraceae bacterium]
MRITYNQVFFNPVYNRQNNIKQPGMMNAGLKDRSINPGAPGIAGLVSGGQGEDARTSVRKQMQDQLRNLFEKERSNPLTLVKENTNEAEEAGKEEDKKDKLLDSGKIYNFKEVSNKIQRAKTSLSAGQAVIAAKRKVSEIKRKLAAAGDDGDELQVALTHARKIEVVAERKQNNLKLEEMVANTQKRDEMLKKMEEIGESNKSDVLNAVKDEITERQFEKIDEQTELMKEEAEKLREEMDKKIEATQEKMLEQMDEFAEEMSDEESEMLREMSEVIDAMEIVDPHMSEEELEKLKTKHRFSEQKALMKADMEYLKSVYKNIDGRSSAGASGISSGMSGAFGASQSMSAFGSASVSVSSAGAIAGSADSGASAPVPAVDVSI